MRKLKKYQYGGFNQFQSYGNVLQSQYNFNNSLNNMTNSLYGIDNTRAQLGPNSWLTAGNASNGFQSSWMGNNAFGNTANLNTGNIASYKAMDPYKGMQTKAAESAKVAAAEKAGPGGNTGSGLMTAFGAIGSGFNSISSLTGVDIDEDSTYNAEQAVGNALIQSGNPYAAAAGLWVKGTSFANQAMGTNMNTMNEKQAKKVGASWWERTGNTVGGFMADTMMPGLGAFFGKTTDSQKSREVDELRGAYANTADDIDVAQTMGGKRYMFGFGKTNNFINSSNMKNELLTITGLNNKTRLSSVPSTSQSLLHQNLKQLSGNDELSNLRSGKQGLKLLSKEELLKLHENKKETVQAFADGGKIGIDTSVIPEGALHAHKNNLEEINPELDEVTQKGIPVIVTDSEGEYKQVAEIEKEELVLTKALTEKIEALWKENTQESMIEAGKLITCELVQNTKDNTEEMLDGND